MRLAIIPVKAEDGTIAFKGVRGAIIHDGEETSLSGAGIMRNDGTFALRLEDEGLWLKEVKRARKVGRSYFVLIRGKMTHNGDDYTFLRKGRAYKLRNFKPRAGPVPREAEPKKPA
jgi:hypothetical protein